MPDPPGPPPAQHRTEAHQPGGTIEPAVADPRRRGPSWPHLPATIGYAAITAAVMWPAIAHFRTRPLVAGADGAMFTWLWWLMPRSIGEGRNPFRTDLIFHPFGADLELTTTSPLVNALTFPVQAAWGTTAQVNTVQLASTFLAGLATYFLVLHVGRHRGAAFVAGIAFTLLPRRFVHVDGQLNLVETAIIPFGLLLLLRFLEVPARGRAVALGVTCGAAFLIDPQLTVLLGMGMLALAWTHRRALAEQLRRLLLAAGVAVVVAAPLLVPMAVALARGGVGDPDPARSTLRYAASPLSWVVPPLERLWIGHLGTLPELTPNWEGVAYPGLLVLVLAVAGVELPQRERRRGWVGIALVGFVLSLGPYPFVGDTVVKIPLPFFLLQAIPGLDTMRVPGRYAFLGALGLVVLAGLALSDLARRHPRRGAALVAAVGLFTVAEMLPRSFTTSPGEAPPAYQALADDSGEGALLEIPLKWSTTQQHFGFKGQDQDFLFLIYQMTHERPVVSGAVSRYPSDDLDRLLSVPLYRQVLALADQPGFRDRASFDAADLRELGIGYVAYHREDPVPKALAYLQALDLPVLADDGMVIIWKVPDRRS